MVLRAAERQVGVGTQERFCNVLKAGAADLGCGLIQPQRLQAHCAFHHDAGTRSSGAFGLKCMLRHADTGQSLWSSDA